MKKFSFARILLLFGLAAILTVTVFDSCASKNRGNKTVKKLNRM